MSLVQADDQKLVLKRLRPSLDWKSIASEDNRCRSVLVWQYGLLDRIRPHMEHAIVAASHDVDGYALLMHDVSPGLLPGKEITTSIIYTLLDALAAMHAIYWEDERLQDPALGLCEVEKLIKISWPEHRNCYSHDTKTIELITRGWDALFDLLAPDARDVLESIMEKPQVITDKLGEFPATFIHADYRIGNLALLPETNQVVALDWQDASYAPAILCLCWFLGGHETYTMRDVYAEYYRQQLCKRLDGKFNQELWHPMLEIGFMVEVLRKGNWMAFFASTHPDEDLRRQVRQVVDSYNNAIRKGVAWL